MNFLLNINLRVLQKVSLFYFSFSPPLRGSIYLYKFAINISWKTNKYCKWVEVKQNFFSSILSRYSWNYDALWSTNRLSKESIEFDFISFAVSSFLHFCLFLSLLHLFSFYFFSYWVIRKLYLLDFFIAISIHNIFPDLLFRGFRL